MNIAIYCGSSFGNDKIYEESAKLAAQSGCSKTKYSLWTILYKD